MRLIDRIALNRLLRLLADFILSVLKILNKTDGKTPSIPKPSPKPNRPLKSVLDKVLPWRRKDD